DRLVAAPYYSLPSQPGRVAHGAAVADATPLPVMPYDVPGRTGVRFAHETLVELAQHDRGVAMKDATGDLYGAAKAAAATG
uniref:dihydrodipicolinate synthase family protein n=1 Tax=Cellulomonas sp. GbtcB1 TaxID=2824746 RepID=UPI001C30C0DC